MPKLPVSCLHRVFSGFKLSTLLQWHATKCVKWVSITRVSLSSTETLLHWEDCQDHPWSPSLLHQCFQNPEVTLNHLSEISGYSACPHGWKAWHNNRRDCVSTHPQHLAYIWAPSEGCHWSPEFFSSSWNCILCRTHKPPVAPLTAALLWKWVSFAGRKIARRSKRNLTLFHIRYIECDQHSKEHDFMPWRIYQCLSLKKMAKESSNCWEYYEQCSQVASHL